MSQSLADLGTYSRTLTRFAVDKAASSAGIAQLLAPSYRSDTQNYDIPVFPQRGSSPVKTEVGPGGSLNILEMGSPSFVPGHTKRRGLKDYINHEDKYGPRPDLMADQKQITDNLTEALVLEEEDRVKAALDAVKLVAGHNATPIIKWDAANPIIMADMRAALAAAEANSKRSRKTGKWKWVINEALAGVIATDPDVIDLLKYQDPETLVDGILPKRILQVEVLIPDGYSVTTAMGQAAAATGIWDGEDIYLVYVDPAASNSRRAYTALAQPYWDQVSGKYEAKRWRDKDEDIKRDWISVDIYDGLDVISQDGIYVLKNLLST